MLQNLKDKIKSLWSNKRIKYTIIGVVVILVIVFLKSSGQSTTSTEIVKKQDLQRTVLASGTVVSSTDLSLSFDLAGTVQSVKVKVGDKVNKGDTLLILANSEQRAAVTSAKGVLLSAQARYKKVLDGSSNEEIALAEVNLKNAKNDFSQTKKTQDTLVENARRVMLSSSLVAENTSNTSSSVTPIISGTYTGETGQYIVNSNTGGDYVTFTGLEDGVAKVSTSTPVTLGTKGLNIIFPSTSNLAGNSWKINIPNLSGLTYPQNLNAYNAALNTRDQALTNSQATIDQRQAELNLKRATARQADIDAALADIVTAQAGLESAQAKLDKTYLIAPTSGTITAVDIKLGETSQPQKEVIVLQDVGSLYLEAKISENNIGNIALGQPVIVSYDAIKDKLFSATISSIDPSATTVGDSVNYKIKALITDTTGILPGMTSNMSILTAEVKDALVVPNRVIDYTGKNPTVKLYVGDDKKKTVIQNVEIGLKGDGDLIEIKSGLKEGDSVLWTPTK